MTDDSFDSSSKPKHKKTEKTVHNPGGKSLSKAELSNALLKLPLYLWKTEDSAPLKVTAFLSDIKEEQIRIKLDVPLRISKRVFFSFTNESDSQLAASVAWCVRERSRIRGDGFRAGLAPFFRMDSELARFRKLLWHLQKHGKQDGVNVLADSERNEYFKRILKESGN